MSDTPIVIHDMRYRDAWADARASVIDRLTPNLPVSRATAYLKQVYGLPNV